MPNRDAWAVGGSLLDGLTTNVSKMKEGTGTDIFCHNPIIKCLLKLNDNYSVFEADILARRLTKL